MSRTRLFLFFLGMREAKKNRAPQLKHLPSTRFATPTFIFSPRTLRLRLRAAPLAEGGRERTVPSVGEKEEGHECQPKTVSTLFETDVFQRRPCAAALSLRAPPLPHFLFSPSSSSLSSRSSEPLKYRIENGALLFEMPQRGVRRRRHRRRFRHPGLLGRRRRRRPGR